MKGTLVPLVFALLGLAYGVSDASALRLGIADDTGKYAEDGGHAFFARLRQIGATENRVTIVWDPAKPAKIPDKPFLDRSLPNAAAAGIRVVFHVYPADAPTVSTSPEQRKRFARFVRRLARTYPHVQDYIIGNEPNQPRFWRPQFNSKGRRVAAATYTKLLAGSYDTLKRVDPGITVIGGVLSSRGNDRPRAKSNASTSPVRFIRDMGKVYRKSGRKRPLMDQFAFHPYPNSFTDPLEKGFRWPNAGIPNLDRIKQAFWDAFRGTAQPTFASGLTFKIDEIGWQVGVVPAARHAYRGSENVATTDEASQAAIYVEMIRLLSCDPSVEGVHLFRLADNPDLNRFQSGLIRADGTRRPSFDAVRSLMASTGGRCTATRRSWKATRSVFGAGADFGKIERPKPARQTFWGFKATAVEQARYRAGVFRVSGPGKLSRTGRAAIVRGLGADRRRTTARSLRPVLATRGQVNAYWRPLVRFGKTTLRPGYYVYAIRLRSVMNPKRASFFVSKPFVVRGSSPR